jgi:hypothetical protein
VEIGLFVRDGSGQLVPIDSPGRLPIIPRIGETISFMTRRLSAKVEAVEYRMPGTPGEALVAVILDRAPSLDDETG